MFHTPNSISYFPGVLLCNCYLVPPFPFDIFFLKVLLRFLLLVSLPHSTSRVWVSSSSSVDSVQGCQAVFWMFSQSTRHFPRNRHFVRICYMQSFIWVPYRLINYISRLLKDVLNEVCVKIYNIFIHLHWYYCGTWNLYAFVGGIWGFLKFVAFGISLIPRYNVTSFLFSLPYIKVLLYRSNFF